MVEEFRRGSIAAFTPALDIYEKGSDLIVEAQLPGIDGENVEVSVENDVLTIQGKSEKKSEVDEKNYYRKEIRSGSFYRSVALPAHVNGQAAKAEFSAGVLRVAVPKLKAEKTTKVKVNIKKK
jgi:HSP20 family protein